MAGNSKRTIFFSHSSRAGEQATFGFSLEMDAAGKSAVVGARLQAPTSTGGAYILERIGNRWAVTAELDPANAPTNGFFGHSASMNESGTTCVVGAVFDNQVGFQAGAVFVFDRREDGWAQRIKYTPADTAPGHWFGESLDLDGDQMLVASPSVYPAGEAHVLVGMSTADCDADGISDSCAILDGSAADENGTGVPDVCEGDVTDDGVVDVRDLIAVILAWGPCADCDADTDGDGAVGQGDLLLVVSNWSS